MALYKVGLAYNGKYENIVSYVKIDKLEGYDTYESQRIIWVVTAFRCRDVKKQRPKTMKNQSSQGKQMLHLPLAILT